MILYPAIDLKDGACVRLLRGDKGKVTRFADDPAEPAQRFAAAGCSWIHVIDLDGAFSGDSVNEKAVAAILAAGVPIQLGGGIRDERAIALWLEKRMVARVILGTVAARDPALVRSACRRWPGKIAVAIDARQGRVAVEGWAATTELKALDLALRYEDAGVAVVIYTDIDRDGAKTGLNLEATVDLAFALTTPVIASGGVSSIADLKAVKEKEDVGIAGVICGRSLYDGGVDLAEALKVIEGKVQPARC